MTYVTCVTGPQLSELPLVGISSCLIGNKVRYDGQHRLHMGLQEYLSRRVRLLPLCPESMAGMGIPRPPVNLIRKGDTIRAVGRDDPERDVTERLKTMARVVTKAYPDLCGYILQSRSPSCGFGTTPLFDHHQSSILEHTNGLFVAGLLEAFPQLPLIDDTRLSKTELEAFLEQVIAYQPF